MISGGNTTIYVSDIDAGIRFYSGTLGLTLTNRFGNSWATIGAGPSYWTTDNGSAGLTIGLHPASSKHPVPGTVGSVGFGLETYEPIESVVDHFRERDVILTSEIIRFEAGNVISFQDGDGMASYVHEFPPGMVPDSGLGTESRTGLSRGSALISGGHAIVYVSSMDTAVRFYTQTLGLTLTNRYGDKFATVEAGERFVIALHPQTPQTPPPGKNGSAMLGLQVDEPIDRVASRLAGRGVRVTGERTPREENRVEIEDPDGNTIYLFELAVATASQMRSADLSAAGASSARMKR
jgi:catechol 2,3-dioxygenase-like lactoylglutathione lyase family enzyme